ncbi:CcdB family protein [Hyphobacterium sp.]|uniref:CcdB family protein n=1 Tax=Hyphobacterium sp. TaxID=2004662 RepID=UPI00374A565B
MARFDLYRFEANGVPLVIDVQAGILDDLASRVVIPLRPAKDAGEEALARLKPVIEIDGEDYVLMTTDIAALPVRRLGEKIGNLGARHGDEISAALDFLFVGF